jgi:hypothetical protein
MALDGILLLDRVGAVDELSMLIAVSGPAGVHAGRAVRRKAEIVSIRRCMVVG